MKEVRDLVVEVPQEKDKDRKQGVDNQDIDKVDKKFDQNDKYFSQLDWLQVSAIPLVGSRHSRRMRDDCDKKLLKREKDKLS